MGVAMLSRNMATATSCEEQRTKAYSEDLRWRMIYQYYALQKTSQQIAESLNVDKSTVSRTIKLFTETGAVSKRRYPDSHSASHRKLTDVDKLLIIDIALSKPGIYLSEIQHCLLEEHGTEVSLSTICRYLHNEAGFTRQKMVITAQQRSELLRFKYLTDMAVYVGHPDLFIFVDETGADGRDRMRKFGYSLRGKPAVANKLLFRGQHISAIAAISFDSGLLDCYTVVGSVTGNEFVSFIRNSLVPSIIPFDGRSQRSIVILDNASIHHVAGTVDIIQNAGALAYFLPPYSPDLNAIEHTFSKVKSVLKANEDDWSELDAETAVVAAFNCITIEDCQGWITHCGYV